MNKLSAFYGEVSQYAKQHDISMDTALKNVKKLGYDYIECYSAEAASNSESKKIIDANGFEVVSFFGSFNFGYDSIEVTKNKIQNFVDLALNADVKKIMPMLGAVRPGDNVNDIMKKMCECINILCEEARRHEITVTIEDCYSKTAPFSTPEQIEYFLKNVDGLYFTMDNGNFAYQCQDSMKIYEKLKSYIVHAHIKDLTHDKSFANASNNNFLVDVANKPTYPCAVGEGFCNLEPYVKKMIADGYKGAFSVELNGAADMYKELEKSANNMREWMK